MKTTPQVVCEDIVALLGKLKNALLEIAEERNITRIQLSALYGIHQVGELQMSKVATILHCDPSNVTGIVDRLVVQGLVVRKECATDRRAKNLQLTAQGQQEVDYLRASLPVKLGCINMKDADLDRLHTLIRELL